MNKIKEKYGKIAVMVNVRDRPSELSLLLQSLYTQTYNEFDIFILDDLSGTPLNNYHFFNCVLNLLNMGGHKVFMARTAFPHGVSRARQTIVEMALKGKYKLLARVDDDVILEADFLERLIKVIDSGYDLASGVTPPVAQPTFIRDVDHIGPVINRVVLDKDGNYIFNGDDCGMKYTDSKIIPAHHFRSSALYKREIHKVVNYTPTRLTKHGFREEQIFSYKCLMAGFKIGVDTGAIAWHQLTPTGGERFTTSNELIKQNEKVLKEFTQQHKNKLNKLFPQEPILTNIDIMKENNLAGKI